MVMRRCAAIALVGLMALLSGCSSGANSATEGAVVGTAEVCQGGPRPAAVLEATKVRVFIVQDTRIIQSQSTQGEHRYRFTVPAGVYVLRSDQGMRIPQQVTVVSGRVKSVDLPAGCF